MTATHAVLFEYRLTGVGWSKAWLTIGERSADMSASDLGDALGDLLRAVRAVAEGASSARASWDDEPIEFRWILERFGGDLRVRILWLEDIWSQAPDADGDVWFEATCELEAFVAAIAGAARRVLEEHGEDGYRARWGGYAFPTAELEALEALR